MIRCTKHPGQVAGWHCSLCASELCVACAALTGHQVVVCVDCGTLAVAHRVPRAEVFPFREVWPAALAPLCSPAGIAQVVIVSLAANLFFTFGKTLWALGCLITVCWVLNVARRTAVGTGAFGLPTWEDLSLVVTGALLRFTCATGLIGVGAMLWTRMGLAAPPLGSPWPWLLAGAAVIAVPPALTIATVEGQGSTRIWPWQLGHWLRVLGADLRPLQIATLLAVFIALFESQLAPVNRELEDTRMLEHLAAAFVPRLFAFVALGALGSLAGLLVFTRAGELAHRRPEDDLVPLFDEPPTGRYVPLVRDAAAEEKERARKYAPIALDESPQLSAIDRGAREEAIAAYRTGELRAGQLELAPAVTLAQWLGGTGDFLAAANLLRVVTARPGGEDGALAKAMVVLARLCAERLDAQAEALRLYEEVARRFPDSAAARFAAEQLKGSVEV